MTQETSRICFTLALADKCEFCRCQQGLIHGVKGFGLRCRGHAQRCSARKMLKQRKKTMDENQVASTNMLAGVYTDPNHYQPGTFAGLRFFSVHKGVGPTSLVTLTGSDDGQTLWSVAGQVFHEKKSVMIDFSPKGGPASLSGNFDGNSVAWEDGNSWTKVHRHDMKNVATAVEGAKSAKDARAAANVSGVYTDPNHRRTNSFAGVRIVSERELAGGERPIVKMVGTDDGDSFWSLTGRKPTASSCELVVDFSQKGGPSELSGTCGEEGILWSDGNMWHRKI